MVKAIKYYSTKIEIPLNSHVNVRVKSDFPIDNSDLEKLNKAYNLAVQRVRAALKELKYFSRQLYIKPTFLKKSTTKNFADMIRLLKQHFNIEFANNLPLRRSDMTYLINILSGVYQGLTAQKHKFYIANSSKKMTYYAFGYVHLMPYINETMYLNLPVLLAGDQDTLIKTIIHEASHLFSGTLDYNCYYDERSNDNFISKTLGQFSYSFFNTSKEKLSTRERINHASSIENFILELTTTPHALKRSTKLNEDIAGGKLISSERPAKSYLQKIVTFSPAPILFASAAKMMYEDLKMASKQVKEKIRHQLSRS